MIRTMGLLCFWLLAISGPALASSCIVPTFSLFDNQTAQGNMYATSGKRCGIVMVRSRGPIHHNRLVAQASHGTVSVEGDKVVYVSRPGYAGDDRFVYAQEGFDHLNHPITRTVEVSVKIADKW